MNIPPKIPGAYADRTLRIVTIAAMAPAFPLLLAAGVLTGRALPALGLVPMAMSLAVSLAALTSKKSSIRTKPTADLIVAASLAFIMVLSWIHLTNDWRLDVNEGMLCAYGITPMIVNFCIHTYLALGALPTLFEPRPCQNCNHTPPSLLPRWQSHVTLPTDDDDDNHTRHPQVQIVTGGGHGHSRSIKEIYQPFLRSHGDEDANARESSEFQTSGFNTPTRQSAETLRSDVTHVRESSEETVRRDGDGKGGSLV